jgi:hypothetical protein
MAVSIEIASKNRLVTLRRSARRMFYGNPRSVTRLGRWLAKYPIKPTRQNHHTDAGLHGQSYRIKQTNTYQWLGFELLVTTRYPLTVEQRASWTSPSHLAASTALRHN